MQITAKLKNKSTPHSLLLKPRVGDVVVVNGAYYQNTSGINSAVTDSNNWFKIFDSTISTLMVDKTSADIAGTDPNYFIDLASVGVPGFPVSVKVYIDLLGDGNFTSSEPVNYNPTTKILSGMNSPIDYPDQGIKILII